MIIHSPEDSSNTNKLFHLYYIKIYHNFYPFFYSVYLFRYYYITISYSYIFVLFSLQSFHFLLFYSLFSLFLSPPVFISFIIYLSYLLFISLFIYLFLLLISHSVFLQVCVITCMR